MTDTATRVDRAGVTEATPRVSVIVPCRNERDFIDGFVASLQQQDYDASRIEFLIADGMSDDGTTQRLEEHARGDPRLHAIPNPGLSVSHGLNLAIRRARGEVIVRMDVHTVYARDYVSKCVEALQVTGAQCVGGPWKAVGRAYMQRAVAGAFQSRLGSGGARSHSTTYRGEVDSVYLGCWRRQTLLDAGLFDEELVRNQDDELCLRLKRKGGLIWQSPDIRSEYHPRGSLRALFRQYYQYGYWKVRVIRKHGQPASLRHLVPAAAVIAGLVLLVAAPFSSAAVVALASLAGAYLLAIGVAAVRCCSRLQDWALLPVLPGAFIAYHAGYGLGFCHGLVDSFLLRRGPAAGATRLTR